MTGETRAQHLPGISLFSPTAPTSLDVGSRKSALAYYLLETFNQKYSLLVVGLPREKEQLLPSNFIIKDDPMCTELENAIVLIDEADLQLPIEDTKAKQYVVNFLSLPRHRHQIFLLAFHFLRLVQGRYLPFFAGFLLKRPPYLLDFAEMMRRAEERFSELPGEDMVKNTCCCAENKVAGDVAQPLRSLQCFFWSKIWLCHPVVGDAKQFVGKLSAEFQARRY